MESKIKMAEDAFNYLGLDPTVLPDVSKLDPADQKDVVNNFILKKVVKAINKETNNGVDWEPDWNNHDQYKYFPWFEVDASNEIPSGFGFSGTHCDGWRAGACVGSRLCFISREACLYAANQFSDLYKQEILILK